MITRLLAGGSVALSLFNVPSYATEPKVQDELNALMNAARYKTLERRSNPYVAKLNKIISVKVADFDLHGGTSYMVHCRNNSIEAAYVDIWKANWHGHELTSLVDGYFDEKFDGRVDFFSTDIYTRKGKRVSRSYEGAELSGKRLEEANKMLLDAHKRFTPKVVEALKEKEFSVTVCFPSS